MLRRGFFLDKTYVFVYNVGGNIVSRSEYVYTEGELGTPVATYNYAYGNAWKDQLTAYNGSTIAYDASGNPTIYLGATLTWNRGRFLASYLKGSKTVIMQYDANGFRRAKTRRISSNTLNSSYVYSDDGKLLYEKAGTFERYYFYSADGIVGYEENGEMFWYKKNFFGDITAVYKGTQKVAEYVYDAWGNCTVKTDTNGYGSRNPFRYRGYYFDNDLGMYYLITRYYDPAVGKFISADNLNYLEPGTINGLNLYAYCGNNPVMNIDPSGHFLIELMTLASLVTAAVAAVAAVFTAVIELFIIGRDVSTALEEDNEEFQEYVKNIPADDAENVLEDIEEELFEDIEGNVGQIPTNSSKYIGAYISGGSGFAFETMWGEFYKLDDLFR